MDQGLRAYPSAFLQKENKTVFTALIIAVIFFIISGLVTKFGNQPINKIVMSWNKSLIPDNWMELRDRWWSFHIARTITSVTAFCIIAAGSIRKS